MQDVQNTLSLGQLLHRAGTRCAEGRAQAPLQNPGPPAPTSQWGQLWWTLQGTHLLHDFEDVAEEDAAGGGDQGGAPQVAQPCPVPLLLHLSLVVRVCRRGRWWRGDLGRGARLHVIIRRTIGQQRLAQLVPADQHYLWSFGTFYQMIVSYLNLVSPKRGRISAASRCSSSTLAGKGWIKNHKCHALPHSACAIP